MCPAFAQGPAPGAVNAAIDKGVAWLLRQQQLDGTWDYGQAPRIGNTALIAYTLVKSGLDPQHQAVQRVFAHLEDVWPERTYDTALLILALEAHGAPQHRPRIQELADQLQEWQKPATGFGYPGGNDLSNTQYAALGLWAAAKAGARIDQRVWFDLIQGTLAYVSPDGGFTYSPGGQSATGSMTAAGIAVLSICRDQLGLEDRGKDKRKYEKVQGPIDGALVWLAKNFSVTENPGRGKAHLGYYLYGLERVGALAPAERIGDRDWYAEGAGFLVKGQAANGSWSGSLGGDNPQTCFALLFLRRATMPVTGGLHRTGGRRFAIEDLESDVRIAASGDNPMGMWLVGFSRRWSEELAWPEDANKGGGGSGPRVSRLIWTVDGVEAARLEGDEARATGAERFEFQSHFAEPGSHRIQATVHVLRPPRRDSSGRTYPASLKVLTSPELEVNVDNAVAEWMLDNARDPSRNLMGAGLPVASASSERGNSGAANAIDGHQARSWIARGDDPTPTLTLTLQEPQEANVILVGHARGNPVEPGRWARALEVDVHVNGERYRLRMHSDERRKGVLVLPRRTRVRELRLVVPFAAPGRGGEASTGFAEVELQLRGDLKPKREGRR